MEVWVFKNKYMCSLNLCLNIYIEREREKKERREMQLSTRTIIIQSACENLFKSLKGSKSHIYMLYLWKKIK